jgi:hypothetical protein
MTPITPAEALGNLSCTGQLDAIPPSPELARRLHDAFQDWLRDAANTGTTARARFDCAYNAIRTAADIGLVVRGYRTPKNRPGHHQTAIQCLAHTLGLPASTVVVLDTLRRQRNAADYEGNAVSEAELAECLKQARTLAEPVRTALMAKGWL